MRYTIFVIDDEQWFIKLITAILQKNGYHTRNSTSGSQAVEALAQERADVILLDVKLNESDGFEICERIRENPDLKDIPIIFVTGSHNTAIINRCYQVGGVDYVGKPIRDYELLAKIKHQLDLKKHLKVIEEIEIENTSLKNFLFQSKLRNPKLFSSFITKNSAIHTIFKYIEAIACTSRSVLITGETGVGKELIAKIIHRASDRTGDFVSINVAGLDDNMFSDTLFGHVKGAFSGAENKRQGLIERASDGTLFLDEIGDLKGESQIKLLRLLQENEYYPLGADTRKLSNARVVVATNRDLPEMAASGQFREDLLYRLRTHLITLPPLRERKDDLPELIDYFVRSASAELGRPPLKVCRDLYSILAQYDFPGNIRELESMIFDAVSKSDTSTLSVESFEETISGNRAIPVEPVSNDCTIKAIETIFDGSFPSLKEMDTYLVSQALKQCDGNQSAAARLLGITRQALNRRLTRLRKESVSDSV